MDDPTGFWERMAAPAIPSKPRLHVAFLAAIEAAQPGGRLLDLGCGDGRLTAELAARFQGLRCLLGIDVNADAIAAARAREPPASPAAKAAAGARAAEGPQHRLTFEVGDITGFAPEPSGPGFDVILLQLVISVIGGPERRRKLLQAARGALAPGGRLLLSASGASADVNAQYAELYRQDEPLTGEPRTYLSRGTDGSVLYVTHHFEEEELRALLRAEGLQPLQYVVELEVSSRRPDQAAHFHYIVAEAVEAASVTAGMT